MFALLVAFVVAAAGQARAQAWSVAPTGLGAPPSSGLNAVAYGNGRFAAVLAGGGPTLVWSTDGASWRASTTNIGAARDIVFAAGAFFAITQTTIWRSNDAATWTRHRDAPAGLGDFTRIATDGDALMVFAGTRLFYAPDTTTWQVTTALPGTTAGSSMFPLDLVFGAGRFVATYLASTVGGGPLNAFSASTTNGGATWSVSSILTNANLAGGAGRLVAINATQIWVTTNGSLFNSTPIPASITELRSSAIMFGGGRFFTKRGLLSSADGLTWTSLAPINATDANFTGIAYGNGRYVAVGSSSASGGPTIDLVAVLPAEGPPVFSRNPAATTVNEGQPLQLSATLENPTTATTFQWYRDGVAISGATSANLMISSARATDAGRYRLDARNAIGTSSSSAFVTVIPIAQAGRILNLSVLTSIDTTSGPDSGFIVGFVVGGPGTHGGKPLLVRAAGPSLSRFGVAAPNPDPRLELYFGSSKIAENDSWGGGAAVSDAIAAVGAFPFTSGASRDAAIFHSGVTPGSNSVLVFGTGGATGPVIAEIYDASPADTLTLTTPRLVNVSVLRNLATGDSLRAGFVLGGQSSTTVLVRAIGPGLTPLGFPGALTDPRLSLFRGGTAAAIANNDNWGGDAALKAAFGTVGAFALADASRDAALVLTLPPGDYTAQASGSGSGNLLIEIYEVP